MQLNVGFVMYVGMLFQGSVVARDPSRLEMYQGEWLVCSWKITNTGGVAFAQGTRLSRVCAPKPLSSPCTSYASKKSGQYLYWPEAVVNESIGTQAVCVPTRCICRRVRTMYPEGYCRSDGSLSTALDKLKQNSCIQMKNITMHVPSWVLCGGGQGEEHSILGGAEDVLVNPLAPGEEQTVSVMLQAPNYVRNATVAGMLIHIAIQTFESCKSLPHLLINEGPDSFLVSPRSNFGITRQRSSGCQA